MKHLLIVIFSLFTLFAYAQKKATKKQKASKEEQIVEITEDQVISTETVATDNKTDEISYVKKFDTTLVPEDNFTKEIDKLLLEIDAVNNAVSIGVSYLKNEKEKNANLSMADFYDKFKIALESEEVRKYYRNLFIRIYRKYYTENEIIQLTNFYKTELGKKAYRNFALIGTESMTDATKFGEYLAKKVISKSNN